LCRANFTFTLMHGAFSVHRGVKRHELHTYQTLVDQTTKDNLPQIVNGFRGKLDILYGKGGEKCPMFAPEIPASVL
jgi:hypothetical protein